MATREDLLAVIKQNLLKDQTVLVLADVAYMDAAIDQPKTFEDERTQYGLKLMLNVDQTLMVTEAMLDHIPEDKRMAFANGEINPFIPGEKLGRIDLHGLNATFKGVKDGVKVAIVGEDGAQLSDAEADEFRKTLAENGTLAEVSLRFGWYNFELNSTGEQMEGISTRLVSIKVGGGEEMPF